MLKNVYHYLWASENKWQYKIFYFIIYQYLAKEKYIYLTIPKLMLNIGKYLTISDYIDNILKYYSILYTSELYLTIPNNISSLLSGLTSLVVLKLFCDPHRDTDRQTDTLASYRGALAPKKKLVKSSFWLYKKS